MTPRPPTPVHAHRPSLAPSIDTCLTLETEEKRWSTWSTPADLEAQRPAHPPGPTLRYRLLTIYRRLFSLVYAANAVAFVIVMAASREKLLAFVNAAGINLLVCGLARHPLMVNAIFRLLCRIPRSAPLALRRMAANAYHYGGVHSGCGVAAFLWYAGLVALITREYWLFPDAGRVSPAVVVLAYVLLLVLVAILTVAYPTFRTKRHDYFELTHRFCAWLAVALFLALLLVFADRSCRAAGVSLGRYLAATPAFWCVLVLIAVLVHPWLLLRRVPVQPESLSPHAVRLHLAHAPTAFGKVIALSQHPGQDWHSFATFPDPDGRSFSCLVSKAGDWTTRCIDQPPTRLWKRGVLMYGFIHVMRLFRRVVVVTTGSGIGPCLSFLSEPNRPPLRIVWQTRNPTRTYGRDVVDLVRRLDPTPVVIDTNSSGRVDMVPVVRDLVREFDAEAVCVISNPRLTKQVVFELGASGVPAFGPIFDS